MNTTNMSKDEYMRYKLIMQPDEAEVRRKLALNPQDPELWYELGMALANKGENDAAVNAFSAGLRYAPFDGFLRFARGRKLASAGHFWPAISELTFASMIDRTEWTFLYYRATTYNLNGYYKESCEDFKECFRIAAADEGFPMIHWLYTTYLLELKDVESARAAVKLAGEGTPYRQMDYGYYRCWQLYSGMVSKEEFINIDEMKEKCLKRPGRIELELNTMYYGLYAYCIETNDEAGADQALRELLKIAVPGAFGYVKALAHAKARGIVE